MNPIHGNFISDIEYDGYDGEFLDENIYGKNVFIAEITQREIDLLKKNSSKVRESKKFWIKMLKTITEKDKELYEILFKEPYPESGKTEDVFKENKCHWNCHFAYWIINRSIDSVKYELCLTKHHCVLLNIHTQTIMDPTFEFHHVDRENWKVHSLAGSIYKKYNEETRAILFNMLSLRENRYDDEFKEFVKGCCNVLKVEI